MTRRIIQGAAGNAAGGGGSSANAYQIEYLTQDDINTFNIGATLPTANNGSSVSTANWIGYGSDLCFNSDGTKFFERRARDRIRSWSLGTGWDFTTLDLVSNFYTYAHTAETTATGMDVKPDGTKVYICGDTKDGVTQYTLSTGWDLSTASEDGSTAVLSTAISDVGFSSDGTKMWIFHSGTTLRVYSLSTAWDALSTLTQTSEQNFVTGDYVRGPTNSNPFIARFKPDGTRVYLFQDYTSTTANTFQYAKLIQIDLTTAWDVTTLDHSTTKAVNLDEGLIHYNSLNGDTYGGFQFSSDGTKMFMNYNSSYTAPHQRFFTLSTAWDITTLSQADKIFYAADVTMTDRKEYVFTSGSYTGMAFTSDGQWLWMGNSTQDRFLYNKLGTAWDVSTSSYWRGGDIYGLNITNLRIVNNDTEIMFTGGSKTAGRLYSQGRINSNGYLNESFVSSGGDFKNNLLFFTDIDSHVNSHSYSIKYIDNGNKILFSPRTGNDFVWHKLSTPYDFSTVKRSSHATIADTAYTYQMQFSSDGYKFIWSGTSSPQYKHMADLETPFELQGTMNTTTSTFLPGSSITSAQRGWIIGNNGYKIYHVNITADTIYECDLTTPYDVNTAVYKGNYLSVSAQETAPINLEFNSDGTVLFVVGVTGDDITSYDLSTAWDITTASVNPSNVLALSSYTGNPYCIKFGDSGTKLYVSCTTGVAAYSGGLARMYQFNLSTAYDLSTATYHTHMAPQGGGGFYGFTFNNNGTKLFVGDNAAVRITEAELTTAWDLDTIIWPWFNANSIIGANTQNLTGVLRGTAMNADGTKLFSCDNSTDSIYEWPLSTAYNFASVGNPTIHTSVNGQSIATLNPCGLYFGNNGNELYITFDFGTEYVTRRYYLSTAYDISSAISGPVNIILYKEDGTTRLTYYDVSFNSDGTKMYATSIASDKKVYQYAGWSTAWRPDGNRSATGTGAGVSSSILAGLVGTAPPGAVIWDSDGLGGLIAADGATFMGGFTCTTAFDITTASSTPKYIDNLGVTDLATLDLYVSADGYTVWTIGSKNTYSLNKITLSTAFDLSTASYDTNDYLSLYTTSGNLCANARSFDFSSDGTRLAVLDDTDWKIYEWTLSTAFDISTASYNTAVDLDVDTVPNSNRALSPRNMGAAPDTIRWNNDGSKLFLLVHASQNTFILTYST